MSFQNIVKHHYRAIFMSPAIFKFYALFHLKVPYQKIIECMTERSVAKIMAESRNCNISHICVSDSQLGLRLLQPMHLLPSQVTRAYAVLKAFVGG